MCHNQPASSHHFPLAIPSSYTCSFPFLSLSISLFSSPPLLVLNLAPAPPRPCVTAAREETKMLQPQKRVKGSKSWSVHKAHRCLHPPWAQLFFDGISRTTEGRRREKRKKTEEKVVKDCGKNRVSVRTASARLRTVGRHRTIRT